PRPVPVTHEVAGALMPLVEAPRVAAYEPVHPRRERVIRQIDDRVPVRREHAHRDTSPGKAVERRDEQPEPGLSIQIVLEVDAGSGRANADVLDAGASITRSSWHASSFVPDDR